MKLSVTQLRAVIQEVFSDPTQSLGGIASRLEVIANSLVQAHENGDSTYIETVADELQTYADRIRRTTQPNVRTRR